MNWLFPILAAVAGAAVPPEPAPIVRFAIVIGQNRSDDPTLPILRYADDDAVATFRLFTEAGIQTTLLVVMDEDTHRLNPDITPAGPPTRPMLDETFARISEQISDLRKRGSPRVDFLLFYSGHGNVDEGEGHIVLQGGRLTRTDLYTRLLNNSPASYNHVIIDACKSFFLAMAKGPGGTRSAYTHPFSDRPGAIANNNTGFILSSSSDRDSHEWERYQAGIFSHEVRSALRGGADAERDGRITYAELGAFLATANQRIDNPRYRPDFYINPPGSRAADLTSEIISWPPDTTSLLVDRDDLGHAYLEDARGERLLDIHPGEGNHFVLRLPATRPLFLRKADESEEYSLPEAADLRLANLSATPASVVRKGAIHLAFENLFKEPFSKAKVNEYSAKVTPSLQRPVEEIKTKASGSTRSTICKTAIWSAVGFGVLGVGSTAWAFYYSGKPDHSSINHSEGIELNSKINKLNTAAVVFYSLAGAALTTWLAAFLWPSSSDTGPTITIAPAAVPNGAGVNAWVGLEW